MKGKIIIFSAPSGSGKTTIVKQLISQMNQFEFSISATSREPRKGEQNGVDYYFLSVEDFRAKIESDAFVEWEEVYAGSFYGTLNSELDRIWKQGKHVIFDVDVKGGINLKSIFKEQALSIFIKTPSIEELEKRLRNRGTETEESIQNRLARAKEELAFTDQFDVIINNDQLETAVKEVTDEVKKFVS